MIARMLARLRPAPQEQPPEAPVEESDDAFLRSLLTDPPASSRVGGPPGYMSTEEAEVAETRPYLELGRTELARHATLQDEVKGRRLQDDVVEGVGGLLNRALLEPMRMVFGNMGVLVTGAVVIGMTMAAATLLGGVARWFFGPLAG